GGWDVSGADEIRVDFGDHSRDGAQLFSDDREFGGAAMDVEGRGVEQLFAVSGGAAVGGAISVAAGAGADDIILDARPEPGSGDDERGFADGAGIERVWAAGVGAEFVAGGCAGAGAFRFRVSDLRGALDVQAADAGGFFPDDGGCER